MDTGTEKKVCVIRRSCVAKEMELLLLSIPFLLFSSSNCQGGLVLDVESPIVKTPGDGLVVKCNLDLPGVSQDGVQYRWYDANENEITSVNSRDRMYLRLSGSRLIINEINVDDEGLYRCNTTVNGEQYTVTFILELKSTVVFTDCPDKQYGELGKKATIRCLASGENTEASWERDGAPVIYDDEKYILEMDSSLTINNLARSDEGTYLFSVLATSDFKSKLINLTVVVPPRILTPIHEGTAIAGEEHRMFCKADGKPLPQIYWYKRGTASNLQDGDRIRVTSKEEDGAIQSTLQFNPVRIEDEEEYTCKAVGIKINDDDTNPLENSTSTFLTVNFRPSIENMEDAVANENAAKELICIARGDPSPTGVWQNMKTDFQYSSGQNPGGIIVSESDIEDPSNPGKKIILQFSSLKSTDGGTYKCIARNTVGSAEGTVNLRVNYKPNFNDQETGPFYTWLGHTEGFIPCTANGDPAPTFTWYKLSGDSRTQVTSADPDYTVIREEDPNDDFKVTSKLLVTYTGSNDGVFGSYECLATNKVGSSPQTLIMQQGLEPAPPIVQAPEIYATKIVFSVRDPVFQGPPVKQYKITYLQQNGTGPGNIITLFRPKETRVFTDDKSGEPETEITIEYLSPRTSYTFNFHSINNVGEGNERAMPIQTKALSAPGIVNILNSPNNLEPKRIDVRWETPDDGGSTILNYILTYQEVTVKQANQTVNPQLGYEYQGPVTSEITLGNVVGNLRVIENGIMPGRYYLIKVTAVNGVGPGTPGEIIVKTSDAQDGLSTGALIGILIAVFIVLFIIVDVFCYFKSNCGVLMTIRESLGGGRGDEGYSAAKTDDVENLAKKDELTEEAKAAEENEIDGQGNDEKKEPLLSEEQKVDTVDEVDTPAEKVIEPEEKEEIKPDTESKPEAQAPVNEDKSEPAPDKTEDKPTEPAQD